MRGSDMAKPDRDLQPRRMTSPREAECLAASLRAIVGECLSRDVPHAPTGAAERGMAAVADFFALYDRRPVRDNSGGSGLNDSLWLFALARAFAPALIVESGTHKGHSAWLFRQACPDAELHSFDIDPGRLLHREPSVRYHLGDWSEAELPAPDPAVSLVFLDDHISHARRLREAHERGFRRLLLDDNFPAHQLSATGGPPVPTLAMILDPEVPPEDEITWTRNGKSYGYRPVREELEGPRGLVQHALVLPDLAPLTRFPPGSALTLVKLVD